MIKLSQDEEGKLYYNSSFLATTLYHKPDPLKQISKKKIPYGTLSVDQFVRADILTRFSFLTYGQSILLHLFRRYIFSQHVF